MIKAKTELNIQEIQVTVLNANIRLEKVEVLLSNLIALKQPEKNGFKIPFEDVCVTLETAIALLSEPISI